jgi:hypothetical protein
MALAPWLSMCGFISRLCTLICRSVYLFSCPYHAVLVTQALYNPLYNSYKKYLRINVIKEVKVLYNENYKTLMKEIEGTNK